MKGKVGEDYDAPVWVIDVDGMFSDLSQQDNGKVVLSEDYPLSNDLDARKIHLFMIYSQIASHRGFPDKKKLIKMLGEGKSDSTLSHGKRRNLVLCLDTLDLLKAESGGKSLDETLVRSIIPGTGLLLMLVINEKCKKEELHENLIQDIRKLVGESTVADSGTLKRELHVIYYNKPSEKANIGKIEGTVCREILALRSLDNHQNNPAENHTSLPPSIAEKLFANHLTPTNKLREDDSPLYQAGDSRWLAWTVLAGSAVSFFIPPLFALLMISGITTGALADVKEQCQEDSNSLLPVKFFKLASAELTGCFGQSATERSTTTIH